MGWTPQRIELISHGRHDEAPASADCYPGMVLQQNSSMQVAPHAVPGGLGPLMVAVEDAWRGADITQKLPANYVIPFRRPTRGDLLLMLLQNGQNVAAGVGLMSAGDGTLVANNGPSLYEIVTPSAVITNVGTETAFSNGTYTIPANTLQVGDVIHVRAKVFCVAENSTNTHRIRLYLGTAPLTLADSTALQLAANDVVEFNLDITVRTIGATGTIIATGTMAYTISGTWTSSGITDVSATLDTTIAEPLVIKSLASAVSAGNQIRLDEFTVNLARAGGLNTLVYSAEAINNSIGAGSSPISGFNSAAFIRVQVP